MNKECFVIQNGHQAIDNNLWSDSQVMPCICLSVGTSEIKQICVLLLAASAKTRQCVLLALDPIRMRCIMIIKVYRFLVLPSLPGSRPRLLSTHSQNFLLLFRRCYLRGLPTILLLFHHIKFSPVIVLQILFPYIQALNLSHQFLLNCKYVLQIRNRQVLKKFLVLLVLSKFNLELCEHGPQTLLLLFLQLHLFL